MVKETPQSPEAVAYQLMKDILLVENKVIENTSGNPMIRDPIKAATRQEILDTYKECLFVTRR